MRLCCGVCVRVCVCVCVCVGNCTRTVATVEASPRRVAVLGNDNTRARNRRPRCHRLVLIGCAMSVELKVGVVNGNASGRCGAHGDGVNKHRVVDT
jgi:hypothetical protein